MTCGRTRVEAPTDRVSTRGNPPASPERGICLTSGKSRNALGGERRARGLVRVGEVLPQLLLQVVTADLPKGRLHGTVEVRSSSHACRGRYPVQRWSNAGARRSRSATQVSPSGWMQT